MEFENYSSEDKRRIKVLAQRILIAKAARTRHPLVKASIEDSVIMAREFFEHCDKVGLDVDVPINDGLPWQASNKNSPLYGPNDRKSHE